MREKLDKPQVGNAKESVWEYPRPPRVEHFGGRVKILFGGEVIVDTYESFRVLETSHPPTYYIHKDKFRPGVLRPSARTSFCEYKGLANYLDIELSGESAVQSAWFYPEPSPRYKSLKDHVAVYAQFMDACYVDGEKVQAQEGDFYGGWITSNVRGPFKGAPGTTGW